MRRVTNYGEVNNINLKMVLVLGKNIKRLNLKLVEQLRNYGITTAQFSVLEALYHKGPLTINEIINTTFSSSGNISLVVNNLCKEEYTLKNDHCDDKRSKVISLSNKGEKLMANLFPEHMQLLGELMNHMTIDEKKIIINNLKTLGKGV